MGKIIIENDNDILMYQSFVDNVEDFILLLNNEFFSFKGGSFTIHRDGDGKIRKVERNDTVYKG